MINYILAGMEGKDHIIAQNALINALAFVITQGYPQPQWTKQANRSHDQVIAGLKKYRADKKLELIENAWKSVHNAKTAAEAILQMKEFHEKMNELFIYNNSR